MNNMEFPIQKRFQMEESPSSPLPDDIFYIILRRLPVKSLLKFRCVCKNWNSIISSPNFTLDYSFSTPRSYFYVHFADLYPKRKLYGKLYESSFSAVSELCFPTNFSTLPCSPCVVGSCNGILCLTNLYTFGREVCLWNPSIRKHKILPPSSILTETFNYRFRVSSISTIPGLGFDSRTNDYKFLRLVLFDPGMPWSKSRQKPRAEIYSLSLDSWRSVELPDHSTKILVDVHSDYHVYIDGAIHWLAEFINKEGEFYSSILRFDVSEERFTEVEIPNNYMNNLSCFLRSPIIFKGLLGLLIFGYETADQGLECVCCIWTVNESIWTKQRVELSGMGARFERIGDYLLLVTQYGHDEKLFLFDPQTVETKALEFPHPESIHAFTETLAFL